MMKKKYLLAVALALTAMVSCTDESFVGDQGLKEANEGVGAISFNLNVPAVTRADKTGSAAATDLNNQFIVWGEKSEAQTNNGADGKDKADAANLVFPNYQVNYVTNSAFTSTSNTEGWEYVGYTHSNTGLDPGPEDNYQAYITTKDGSSAAVHALSSAQTIKYWDWGASCYTFTAVSAKQDDIKTGKVQIQKLISSTENTYGKGYNITLTADADPSKVYIADRKVITKTESGSNTDRTQDNKYGGNVTLRFRNLLSQIRVGMYETVPGHTVTINSFEYIDNAAPTFATMNTSGSDQFYANVPNVATTSAANLVVTYWDNTSGAENTPKVAISGTTGANYIALGGEDASHTGLKADAVLAESAASPTYNETTGAFTSVYPQEANTKNLKLKVNYTLTAGDTGETITVEDATAEIPAAYLQWKPNFKYTYLFKISDNTNGYTGGTSDPAGLYPITFDAAEIIADDGKAEYITTVSEPSITTFGVKDRKFVTGQNEYTATSDIYATITDNNVVVSQVLGTNVNVYLATTSDATNFPITEASVAESLAEISAKTHKITVTLKNDDGTTSFTSVPEVATTVPKEDGTSISSIKCVLTAAPWDWVASNANVYYSDEACGTRVTTAYADGTYYKKDFALKLTGAAATTANTALVVEYVKTARTHKYVAVPIADADEFATVKEKINLYTDNTGTEYDGSSAFNNAITYYKKVVDNPGVYAYKVIKVVVP